MTKWGYLLLCTYVALGLSPAPWRKACRLAVLFTALVLAYEMTRYGALR